jgi:predicted dehydrogenase
MVTRRDFVKAGATATAVLTAGSLIPGAVGCAPSDVRIVRIGVIGLNGMGYYDLNAFLRQPNVECVALCDIDSRVLNKRAGQVEQKTGKKPELFADYREMLARQDIEAVLICTPDHWHAIMMIEACKAGKHVYVEKPMANTINEVLLMERAAKKYNSIVQVGMWQRSDPHWNDAFAFIQSGKLGKIRTIKVWCYMIGAVPPDPLPDEPVPDGVDYDQWLGPAPLRPFNRNRFHQQFRWYWDYAGGLMTDWGVHLLDMALAGMQVDLPKSAMSSGGKFGYPESGIETPDTQQVIYEFDGFNVTWDHGMGVGIGDWNREHGLAFIGNNGTLVVDRDGWEVHPETDDNGPRMEAVTRIPGSQNGLDLHARNFIDCVRAGNRQTNAGPATGRAAAIMAHLGNIALRTGRKVCWDAEKNEFIHDPEASRFLKPAYRDPWQLPVL